MVIMGEEEDIPTVTLPPSSHSPSVRFLGLLKQPDSDATDHLEELDESDLIWPSDLDLPSSAVDDPAVDPTYDNNNSSISSSRRFYSLSGFGLSAALSDDAGPTLRTRSVKIVPVGSGTDSAAKSAPVNVPTWQLRKGRRFDDVEEKEEEDKQEEDKMVPPHVMVARSHVMTFSVFEGVGRTLKGRDLRRVRNAVFRKTGFLD